MVRKAAVTKAGLAPPSQREKSRHRNSQLLILMMMIITMTSRFDREKRLPGNDKKVFDLQEARHKKMATALKTVTYNHADMMVSGVWGGIKH